MGVNDLQNQLFALPDADLQLQADAIGNDFKGFISAHFELSTSQISFLDNIDQQFVDTAAAETKQFIERRHLVGLIKEDLNGSRSENGEGGDRGKLLDLDKKKVSSFSENEGYQSSQSLNFIITYPAV